MCKRGGLQVNIFTYYPKSLFNSMLHQIGLKFQKVAQSKSSVALSPAVVETYSRLLVYTEIESLGTKGLVNQILPKVANESRQVLHTLLEMISYRMHHIQTVFRIQLLTTLHTLSSSPHVNHRQLHLRIESTALRLIMGFENFVINPQLVRLFNDQKQIVSRDSEELNRVLVLTLARSIYITGAETISGLWCTDILKSIMAATPHRWPQETLACFPRSMQDFFQQHNVEELNKTALRDTVEEEYVKWQPLLTGIGETSYTENDMMKHFSTSDNPYFICLLWKAISERKQLTMSAYKVLEHMGASQLSSHVRTFSDFLISEFSVVDGGDHLKVCADLLQDMVWKYNIVFPDRLILCLALRSSEPNEIRVAFFIIQFLLIKPDDFRNAVHHFVQEVDDIDHWTQNDWHSKHMSYHQKFPEMYYFEGLLKHCSGADQMGDASTLSSQQYLPTYFSNITLRILPVLDIVIHRCLELLPGKSLEKLLDHLGLIYKFHDQPITYLFNTLLYYEAKLRDNPSLKKKLVSTIIGGITENKPAEWALSEEYVNCCLHSTEPWQPTNEYYCSLVKRLVDSIGDKKPAPFTSRDWRFNEFPNACAHALQVTCVEALALPVSGDVVGQSLMDVVLKSQPAVSRDESLEWMNATALILTALPEIYWKPLHKSILQMLRCDTLTSEIPEGSSYPYHVLSYSNQQLSYSDLPCTRLLALTHIVWHHMSIGQLSLVSQLLKDEIRPIVETELQMLYVYHLIGPYIPRYQVERTRCMMDVALVLYDILLRVSKHTKEIRFVDEIADFLYHVKYMHIGVVINDKIEEVVVQLQPAMRRRLRFITHAQSTGRTQVL
uniref:Mediator of RNA polymerase II transcription subunit 23 n=1 Tax=Phallusia mammillata TaxID=59560 RepID=A0A6F9DLE4_9ASCI|nr:mediator of RNA polymerase II transcription subunit 23-like [Phallusia mammillata]